jgi:hypothetical protein
VTVDKLWPPREIQHDFDWNSTLNFQFREDLRWK